MLIAALFVPAWRLWMPAIYKSSTHIKFAIEDGWQEMSGAANAHFLSVRNVVLAVDSFSIECAMPAGIPPKKRAGICSPADSGQH